MGSVMGMCGCRYQPSPQSGTERSTPVIGRRGAWACIDAFMREKTVAKKKSPSQSEGELSANFRSNGLSAKAGMEASFALQ
jgi:hypothetical protein